MRGLLQPCLSPTLPQSCETVSGLSWICRLPFFFFFSFFSSGRFSGCSPLLSRFRQLAYHFLFWRESWAHCYSVKVRAANVFYFIYIKKLGGGGGGVGGWVGSCCSSSASCSRLSVISAFRFRGVWSVRSAGLFISAGLLARFLPWPWDAGLLIRRFTGGSSASLRFGFSVGTCGTLLGWILLELSPHVGEAQKNNNNKNNNKKTGIFRRSRACHNSLLQPALSPRNPVVGVHIEGLAQPVALHNRLSRPVGHLRTLPWRNPMAPARLVDPDVERKTKCLPSACLRPETYFVPSLPQETTAPSELPSALLGQWGGGGGGGGTKKINSTLYIPDLWYRCSHIDELESCEMMMKMKLTWCWCYDVRWASIWCGWCDGQYMQLEKLKRNKNHIIIQICLFIL